MPWYMRYISEVGVAVMVGMVGVVLLVEMGVMLVVVGVPVVGLVEVDCTTTCRSYRGTYPPTVGNCFHQSLLLVPIVMLMLCISANGGGDRGGGGVRVG